MDRRLYTPNSLVTAEVTIASGQALSDIVNAGGLALVGIVMPAGWDAASLTLQAGASRASLVDVYDGAAEVSLTVGADRFIVVDPTRFQGLTFFRLRSGTAAAAVNQSADRVLKVILRG